MDDAVDVEEVLDVVDEAAAPPVVELDDEDDGAGVADGADEAVVVPEELLVAATASPWAPLTVPFEAADGPVALTAGSDACACCTGCASTVALLARVPFDGAPETTGLASSATSALLVSLIAGLAVAASRGPLTWAPDTAGLASGEPLAWLADTARLASALVDDGVLAGDGEINCSGPVLADKVPSSTVMICPSNWQMHTGAERTRVRKQRTSTVKEEESMI